MYHEVMRAGYPGKIKTNLLYGIEEPNDNAEFIEFARWMGNRYEDHLRITKRKEKELQTDAKTSVATTTSPIR